MKTKIIKIEECRFKDGEIYWNVYDGNKFCSLFLVENNAKDFINDLFQDYEEIGVDCKMIIMKK